MNAIEEFLRAGLQRIHDLVQLAEAETHSETREKAVPEADRS